MAGEDFVQVQMSQAGVALAGDGGEIRVENSRSHFHFKAGVSQRVVKGYEWGYLATLRDAAGDPLFELVPAAPAIVQTLAPTPEAIAAAAALTAQLAAEAAAHETHTDSSATSEEHQ